MGTTTRKEKRMDNNRLKRKRGKEKLAIVSSSACEESVEPTTDDDYDMVVPDLLIPLRKKIEESEQDESDVKIETNDISSVNDKLVESPPKNFDFSTFLI